MSIFVEIIFKMAKNKKFTMKNVIPTVVNNIFKQIPRNIKKKKTLFIFAALIKIIV